MNSKRIFLALVFVAALAQQSTITSAQSRVQRAIVGLPGSWRATFTSAENPPQFAPIPALFTFTQKPGEHGVTEGTLVETDGGELVPIPSPNQAFGSPGHGVWRKIGNRKYEIKFLTIAVNPDGSLAATGRIRLTVELNEEGDRFEGEGTFKFTFADGTAVPGGSGNEKIRARLIELE